MSRIKVTTTLKEDLYKKARSMAKADGLRGANDIIEKSLQLYFDSLESPIDVWEKEQGSGWLKKITVFSTHAIVESIRYRKFFKRNRPQVYSHEWFEKRGFLLK